MNRPYAPRYCPYCGTRLGSVEFESRERAYCDACDRIVFRNAVPGAGVAVVDGDAVLLIERDAPPGVGEWSTPGGHLEYDEPAREGAVRELREETGLRADPGDLTILDTRLLELGEKTVLSVGYAVERERTTGEPQAGSDARAAAFLGPGERAERTLRDLAHHRIRSAFDRL